jgi:hypothetical protein
VKCILVAWGSSVVVKFLRTPLSFMPIEGVVSRLLGLVIDVLPRALYPPSPSRGDVAVFCGSSAQCSVFPMVALEVT